MAALTTATKDHTADPWRRFAVLFAALAVSAELAYYGVVLDSAWFGDYIGLLARTSGVVLDALGYSVGVAGSALSSPQLTLEVGRGCDALQLCALLTAAIVAFPAPLARRVRGVALGVAGLQALNFVRVVSLFSVGVHFPGVFGLVHRVVWPGALIGLAVLGWIAWVIGELRRESHAQGS